ncbi:hypothetical protein [Shewanella gelidii]|uniref:Uncharacterized protein n=1 Tax=Shewanella gelidii TaxID=1642821 RepID=A0A917NA17_9GAMM|nr:hypothetical protein [Shewanella gelidii]MCL1099235.1 hypothetical protein [Shewanella gelidii]GGI76649.1 hypothetical protein GCM10009332_12530 [Shewanella gelidii]
MSYHANGHEITVNFPVDSISVNKTSIAFTDREGKNKKTFSKRTEAIQFMKWLITSNK